MEVFKDIKVTIKEEKDNYGLFEISPLPRGYGHTLGNALRRILYSSLKGAGITSVKIKGVEHEYSTIKGVKEDVLEIVMNLKQIKFRVDSDEPQECKIVVKGRKEIKASDIQVSGVVTVATPDVLIATVTDEDTKIEMDFVVESGIGYKDIQDADRKEIGVIPLDCDFSPIEQVSMNVGQARKGQETDWDSVLIGVWTDGSISPKESLLESSKILQEFAGKTMIAMGVSKLEVETRETEINTVEESEEVLEDTQDNVDNWKVEDLPISKRSKTALLSGGFKVMADFKEANIDDLLNLAGFGNKSLNEVIELLNQYGINIKK